MFGRVEPNDHFPNSCQKTGIEGNMYGLPQRPSPKTCPMAFPGLNCHADSAGETHWAGGGEARSGLDQG